MNIVDLRSDTVTRPTPAMRDAMAAAEVGDDVFGDDPTVNALQERIAAALGKEAGAVRHQRHAEQPGRGDERTAGAATSTSSARWRTPTAGRPAAPRCSAASSRSRSSTSPTARWRWPTIEAAIKPDDAHLREEPAALPREHDRRQGAAAGLPDRSHARLPGAAGLATHLDGARLFNAAAALGGDVRRDARAIAAPFDTVSVCFSKGLGAPVGSALVGSRDFIARAHGAGARCSAAACARPACSRPPRCTRSITTSSAWPTTTRWRGASPPGCDGVPGLTVDRAADQHRLRRTCAASAPTGCSRT